MTIALTSCRVDRMYLNTVWIATKRFGVKQVTIPWWWRYSAKGRQIIKRASLLPTSIVEEYKSGDEADTIYVKFLL